ncbi:MAG: hypothetical protein HC831_24875 [Chloroflexia bacterium]|nr:hypothetical protein [Chloroflexia bacterium]
MKTNLDGIKIKPYYRSEHLKGLEHILNVKPGEFPFVRGEKADNNWLIRQDIVVEDFAEANKTALNAIERGTESIAFAICTENAVTKMILQNYWNIFLLNQLN